MNVFAKFDEILSMILQDIKETKCYGHTVSRSDGLSDNVKTVYPPTNTVCGGYNKGADQLRGYREADLRLCFRICKKPVFSQRGSNDSDIFPTKI